jgi:hypothetical protein
LENTPYSTCRDLFYRREGENRKLVQKIGQHDETTSHQVDGILTNCPCTYTLHHLSNGERPYLQVDSKIRNPSQVLKVQLTGSTAILREIDVDKPLRGGYCLGR